MATPSSTTTPSSTSTCSTKPTPPSSRPTSHAPSSHAPSPHEFLRPVRTGPRLPPAAVPCRYFASGYCSRGTSCWYKHARTDADGGEGSGKQKGKDADGTAEDAELEPEKCAICFEQPEMYGIMTGCDHVFCLTCIRSWRSTTKGARPPTAIYDDDPRSLRATSKTCPLCRVRTQYIVPSPTFPTSAETKATIISVYLKRLSTLPCRYFTASLKAPEIAPRTGRHPRRPQPDCPFGNDCFYAHEIEKGKRYEFTEQQLARRRWAHKQDVRRRHEGLDAGHWRSRWWMIIGAHAEGWDADLDVGGSGADGAGARAGAGAGTGAGSGGNGGGRVRSGWGDGADVMDASEFGDEDDVLDVDDDDDDDDDDDLENELDELDDAFGVLSGIRSIHDVFFDNLVMETLEGGDYYDDDGDFTLF